MSKKLIAYFSATGRTAKVAKLLAKALGADIYEIWTHYSAEGLEKLRLWT